MAIFIKEKSGHTRKYIVEGDPNDLFEIHLIFNDNQSSIFDFANGYHGLLTKFIRLFKMHPQAMPNEIWQKDYEATNKKNYYPQLEMNL